MADIPVATLRPNRSSITIYLHTDHLGTPRKITNPSGNTVVWRWDPDTFGSKTPSITTISYNLRFPGQYYQSETGLNYNYFRVYDLQTGRYIEDVVPSSSPREAASQIWPDQPAAASLRPCRGAPASPRAQCAVRGKHAVEARQVHPRPRHQRRQACDQIQRLQHDVGRAIAVRGLELIAHLS